MSSLVSGLICSLAFISVFAVFLYFTWKDNRNRLLARKKFEDELLATLRSIADRKE